MDGYTIGHIGIQVKMVATQADSQFALFLNQC